MKYEMLPEITCPGWKPFIVAEGECELSCCACSCRVRKKMQTGSQTAFRKIIFVFRRFLNFYFIFSEPFASISFHT
jgi:hypothetical protein